MKQHLLIRALLTLLLTSILLVAGELSIVHTNGQKTSLTLYKSAEGSYISAVPFFTEFNSTGVYSAEKRKLLVRLNETDIQFTENNPFCRVGESVFSLRYPPKRDSGDFLLYLPSLIELLDPLLPESLSIDTTKGILTILSPAKYPAPPAAPQVIVPPKKEPQKELPQKSVTSTSTLIRRALCEEKKNGTLLTLFLPESLVFDFTYFRPQLNLNIFKGKVSVSEINRTKCCGAVKSIEAIQFADNAQLAFVISDNIRNPEAIYRSNPPRIELTLRPEDKVALPAPQPIIDTPTIKPAPAPQQPVPTPTPPPLQKENKNKRIKTIIIDPGHGGKDPGAVNDNLKIREKSVVLDIGLRLRDLIRSKMPEIKVLLTRDTDVFIPLKDRSRIANEISGDLFISIHANAIRGSPSKRNSVGGYCVFFLDVARNDAARATAALENSAMEYEESKDVKPENSNDIDFILKTSELNSYRNESESFAIRLEQELDQNFFEIKKEHTGVNQAGFYVLRFPEMPAVLIETAYISNNNEAQLLSSGEFQQKVAEAVLRSIEAYRAMREGGSLGK